VSPTRLEAWATCPHAYLVRYVLGVEAVENPEESLEITPIDRGNLVHKALEEYIDEVLRRPEADRPGPGAPWTSDDALRLREIGERLCVEYEGRGLTGRPLFWKRDRARVLGDLMRFIDEDNARRLEQRSSPRAAELRFGFGDRPPVEIRLTDGRAVAFRGSADRVDVGSDGTVHVVDYKTGSSRAVDKLTAADPCMAGTKLQLPIYGLAARAAMGAPDAPVTAEYWFTSSRGDFKRKGFPIDGDVIGRFTGSLEAIVAGIEAGVFPNRPGDDDLPWVECDYCDPDGLGTAELRRSWDRKQQDEQLSGYLALVAPAAVDDDA
jgi:ATP-dependent helicase/DNAse subunit B